MESMDAVRTLAGLAQLSRLAIFRRLVAAGPQGVQPTPLAEALGIPANTLSFHLKGLMAAQLISQERRGRALVYRADFERMGALLAFLTDDCCGGIPCGVEVVAVPLVRSKKRRVS
jgi:DNA-binding transcriptional ArsR family regulator